MPRTSYSITRLASGTYQARYRDIDGRQRAKSFGRKVDATAFLDEMRSQVRRGTWIDPDAGRERFGVFAERWAASQDWKQSTRDSFGPHLRRIMPHLGHLELGQLDRLTLDRTRQVLSDAGYAVSTVTITMHYACTIARAAYQAGLIARDPTIGVRPPRRRVGDPDGRVDANDVPTRAEVLGILDGAPRPFRAAVALGLAGLRVSEMLGVTADRVDLDERTLLIDRQLQRIGGETLFTGPKREKVRRISLPSVTVLELRRHLRDYASDGLLFRGLRSEGEGMRRDAFYVQAWRPALVAAGLAADRYKFHSLRHWCASSMLAAGAPITAVAGHFGDTVETISKVYLHWLRDDREIPAAVLDGLLAERPGAAEMGGS